MFPERYPASEDPICLSMNWSGGDATIDFWDIEADHLTKQFKEKICPLIEQDRAKHFSLFCMGTIPLLIKLGTLFNEMISVDTYQLTREPKGWCWEKEFPEGFKFIFNDCNKANGNPVLIISISAAIDHKRIEEVMGKNVSIWELTVPKEHIGNDNICNRKQLCLFRNAVRNIIEQIKEKHGSKAPLSIFPAMAVSCAVEMGRVRMSKSYMPWIIFDQNNKRKRFIKAMTIR